MRECQRHIHPECSRGPLIPRLQHTILMTCAVHVVTHKLRRISGTHSGADNTYVASPSPSSEPVPRDEWPATFQRDMEFSSGLNLSVPPPADAEKNLACGSGSSSNHPLSRKKATCWASPTLTLIQPDSVSHARTDSNRKWIPLI